MQSDGKKRGAIAAGIALVLVVAIAAVAYGVLAPKRAATSSSSIEAAPSPANDSASGSSASASSSDSASATGANAAIPLLANYDATVYTELNEPLRLTAIADGRPMVMNFWATWCPYCVEEMPDYLQIYNEYKDRVSFAFIDCVGSKGETADKALDWLKQNGFGDLPAYFDNDREASSTYGAWSLPTTVVVSAQGEIQGMSAGAIDPARMRNTLDSLV